MSVAQAVQSMIADVGIQSQIQVLEAGALIATLTRGEYQAGFAGWSGRPDPDFDVYPFMTKSGIPNFNFSGYVNSQVQDLLDAARVLQNMDQRARAYREVTQILADDMPYAWISFTKEYKLVSVKVRGFVHVPDGLLRLRTVSLAS